MNSITIQLDGIPVAKGRPRFAMRGRGVPIAYTPEKTRNYESDLRLAAQVAMGGRPLFMQALIVTVTVVLPFPKSLSLKKRQTALPTKRPDLDNFYKAALDALNCVVFCDDSQVVSSIAHKRYGDKPSLKIEVEETE